MCQQQQQLAAAQNNANNNNNANTEMQSNNKSSYSIKRVLQTIFRNKQQQKQQKLQRHQQQRMQSHQQQQQHYQYEQPQRLWNSLESLESLENLRNAQMEEQHYYEEIEDNSANEKLAELVQEDVNAQAAEHDVYVPVRFARTEAGTFFWTTNLQPVLSSFTPVAADEDLLQPSYCYSNAQYPHMQYPQHNGDRWAQA